MTNAPLLSDFVGGAWVDSRATSSCDVYNPATGAVIAKSPLGTRADVDAAVAAAKAAFPAWRATPVVERARAMFAFKDRLEEHFEEIARIVTTEHGKTLDESRGSVRRGIEAVEVACGMPSMMMGYGLEDIARGSTATSTASRSASSRRSRRSTSPPWCRSGSSRSRSRPATRSS